jgi:tetratricopeptide (TPR) repeat protein
MKKSKRTKKASLAETKTQPLSRRKRAVFTLLTILSPIVFLGSLELCLRLFKYHSETDSLVAIRRFQGKEYYCINPNVGKNYFASHNVGVPEPYEEIFEVAKSPRTYRVFCVGESTMYGYPYPSNITAPRFLKDRLKTLFPDKNIEVINLGIPAVSSSVVLDLVRQVIEYSPDLIIVYSGHNEFYGTYGVASTEYVAYNKGVLDFYMRLRKLKTVLLLREGINWVRTILYGREALTRRATFLERMVKDRYIVYGSSKYERAKLLFRENLAEMAGIALNNNTPICFSTLVSNWKDQHPFISLFSSDTKPEQREQWGRNFHDGTELEKQKNYAAALAAFTQALRIDSMRADLHYHMGECYFSLGEYGNATTAFLKAKDLDVLRFRATDEFNDIIRAVGVGKGAWVVDLEKAFAEKSPHGILGNELLSEHLHPNVEGYFLMGKTFCLSMAEHNQIKPYAQWDWTRDKQDGEYHRMAAYTDLDIESANIRIGILTSAWPFQEEDTHYTYTPVTPVQQIAFAYCRQEYTWEKAHYEMAAYYQQQSRYDLAAKEYEAVAKELYLFYHPRMLDGDMKILEGKFKDAEAAYMQAFKLDPNQFVRLRLGTLYLKEGKIEDAILHFIAALAIDQGAQVKFTREARITTYLALGSAYNVKGEKALARDAFQQALALDPDNRQARALLERLGVVR